MKSINVYPTRQIKGTIDIPGDKSISHRAILLGSITNGTSQIRRCSTCNDCISSMRAIESLGIKIERNDLNEVKIYGQGLHGFSEPKEPIDCGRSGTTIRLIAGLLVGQSFSSILTGDPQLLKRPMNRIAEPLVKMGAEITTNNGFAPIQIHGTQINGFNHDLSIASAQVKSAILLAGLYAKGKTTVSQPGNSRDHTEKMLLAMGAELEVNGSCITIQPTNSLKPLDLTVAGDISSAAYPIAAAILADDAEIICKNVGINRTRTGLIDVLQKMGANIEFSNKRLLGEEPVADIKATTSKLRGVEVSGDTVVRMIDEFPIFAVLATQANGKTIVKNAKELRVKETDRIKTVATELSKLGADITTFEDGFEINGPTKLSGDVVNSHGDHRLAMALIIAGITAGKPLTIDDVDCISDSYPPFFKTMQTIGVEYD